MVSCTANSVLAGQCHNSCGCACPAWRPAPSLAPDACAVLTSCCFLPVPVCCACLPRQEKVYSPEQMSGLESLMVPPLAAVRDYVNGNCPVTFGARITTAMAAAAPAPPDSSSSSKRKEQGLQAGQLQQLLGQQPPASNRHYMLFVTGRRRQVRAMHCDSGTLRECRYRCTHLGVHTRKPCSPGPSHRKSVTALPCCMP